VSYTDTYLSFQLNGKTLQALKKYVFVKLVAVTRLWLYKQNAAVLLSIQHSFIMFYSKGLVQYMSRAVI